jgi:signal transduction histidine kinase
MMRVLAAGSGAFVVAQVVAAAVLSAVVGWSFTDALEAFVVTNSVMGAAFAVCGAIIAWHRPRNPIGWLLVADGLGHATTAFGAPLAQTLTDADAPIALVRATLTLAAWAWPWSIGLFLPLALTLFPNGRLPSRRWRPAVVGVTATAPLFAVAAGAAPTPLSEGFPPGYVTIASYDALAPLWTFSELRNLLAFGLAIASLLVRYRRGGESLRRQLLWLVLATITVIALIIPWAFVAGTPIVVLFAIPLIPLAITVAILRHRLLDIRLVLSRFVSWALLSGLVIGGYAVVVAALDNVVSARIGRSAVVTVIIAMLVAPLLPPLQRAVERAMYGDRRDVARVVARVGSRLRTGGLEDVAAAVREALRLPYVSLSSTDEAPLDVVLRTIPLEYAGEAVGELVVGLRPGEREIADRDRDVLLLVAAPLAVALHATKLSADLQASRGRIVAAREEERRRLRRDLHDGLGPTLTGVAFAADAAANLVDSDAPTARRLLSTMRTDVRIAIADIRRLIEDLRPPALDELGLVEALRRRTEQLSWRADGAPVRVSLDVVDTLPELPAAIEVAAYRIAAEALTNIVRHSSASSAVLRLRCTQSLDLEILDDGPPVHGAWQPGVGLHAMRERADELGGSFQAGPSPTGGRVFASFPLATS